MFGFNQNIMTAYFVVLYVLHFSIVADLILSHKPKSHGDVNYLFGMFHVHFGERGKEEKTKVLKHDCQDMCL